MCQFCASSVALTVHDCLKFLLCVARLAAAVAAAMQPTKEPPPSRASLSQSGDGAVGALHKRCSLP